LAWIKAPYLHLLTQDYEYLSPIIKEIEKERSEREDLESMVVKKPIPGAK
jgi:hypothetical protein